MSYRLYKPLRNHLSQVDLAESLYVIRAHIQYLHFDQPIPPDVEIPTTYRIAPPNSAVLEWELETIAREVILNAQEYGAKETFKKWSYLASAINKLKRFENELCSTQPPGSVLLELYRIAHRQFPWQIRLNAFSLARYFKIFNHPSIDAIVKRVMGLSVEELYVVGMAFTGLLLSKFAVILPLRNEIPGIGPEHFERFIKHFSLSLEDLKAMYSEHQRYNYDYPYLYDPLRQFPLIRMKLSNQDALVSPIPPLLFHRFTDGLYYEICGEKDFGVPFGKAFESYIGETLKAAVGFGMPIHEEKEYFVGRDRKDTVDWILEGKEAALFIECKTRRVGLNAKVEIATENALNNEIEKMANFIVQIYKTLFDYKRNLYPSLKFNPDRKIFPLILTLEDWYFFGGKIGRMLEAKVNELLRIEKIDLGILKEAPYTICPTHEFEKMVQIIARVGVFDFMSRKVYNPEKVLWPMSSYMADEFGKEYSHAGFLFPEMLDKLEAAHTNPSA